MVQWCSVSEKNQATHDHLRFPVDQIRPLNELIRVGNPTASDVKCEAVECHY